LPQALIDSGPLFALFSRHDRWHAPVVAWLQAHPEMRLVCTWPVLTEVCALLASRIGNHAALRCMAWVEQGGVLIDNPDASSLAGVRAACERYADLPLDLADASIAEAAQRLAIQQVVSIDTDFDIYRDARGRRLKNLLR
jgi:uncharacterized protein